MKLKNGQRQLTYEEIARKYDMTPAKAHSIVKQAYNKMIKALVEKENINIKWTELKKRYEIKWQGILDYIKRLNG